VRPKLVAEVEFATWTNDGLLRQASFIALRDDKPAKAVGRERVRRAKEADVKRASGESEMEGIKLTHPDRVLYSKLKLTKEDLARYYLAVAEQILPHVADRPLSIVRCPDGQSGACFYQKHFTPGMPDAIRPIRLKEGGGYKQYVSINDAAGLVALVQFGVLELHPWGCAAGNIEAADRIVLDLDPDPAVAWPKVIAAAKEVRDKLSTLGLRSFLKTTGGKGLHVVAPLSPPMPWRTVKDSRKPSRCGWPRTILRNISPRVPRRRDAGKSTSTICAISAARHPWRLTRHGRNRARPYPCRWTGRTSRPAFAPMLSMLPMCSGC